MSGFSSFIWPRCRWLRLGIFLKWRIMSATRRMINIFIVLNSRCIMITYYTLQSDGNRLKMQITCRPMTSPYVSYPIFPFSPWRRGMYPDTRIRSLVCFWPKLERSCQIHFNIYVIVERPARPRFNVYLCPVLVLSACKMCKLPKRTADEHNETTKQI